MALLLMLQPPVVVADCPKLATSVQDVPFHFSTLTVLVGGDRFESYPPNCKAAVEVPEAPPEVLLLPESAVTVQDVPFHI